MLLVVHSDCDGISESSTDVAANFPSYTGTRTHLLYLDNDLAIVRPEGGGDDLRVPRDARSTIGHQLMHVWKHTEGLQLTRPLKFPCYNTARA